MPEDDYLSKLQELGLQFEETIACCMCQSSFLIDQRPWHQHGPWQKIHVDCHIKLMGDGWKDCKECARAKGVPEDEIDRIQDAYIKRLEKRMKERHRGGSSKRIIVH